MLKNIVHKILVFCIISAGFLFVFPSIVHAGELSARHNIQLDIEADGHGQLSHQFRLENRDRFELIKEYKMLIPYEDVSEIKVWVNNNPKKFRRVQNNVTVIFPSPILQNRGANVRVEYKINNLSEQLNGLSSVYLPKFRFSEKVNRFDFKINLAADIPGVAEVYGKDFNREGNSITTKVNQDFKIIWGQDWDVIISENREQIRNSNSGERQLVSLPLESAYQTVQYSKLQADEVLYEKSGNNVWANAANKFEYTAKISRLPSVLVDETEFTPLQYGSVSLPGGVDLTGGPEAGLYRYLIENYQPEFADFETPSALLQDDDQSLAAMEAVYLLSNWFTSAGVDHRIAYGYFYGVNWPGFDENLPHVWLETFNGENVVILDPYLEMITGMSFYNVSDLGRVHFGIWDKDAAYDTLLGLIGPGLRTRPQVLSVDAGPDVLGAFVQGSAIPVEIQVDHPKTVQAGDTYSVVLRLINNSGQNVGIDSLFWDDLEITSLTSQVNNRLNLSIPPNSTVDFQVDNLAISEVFFDGNKTHTVSMQTNIDEKGLITSTYELVYYPNPLAILSIIAVLLLGCIFLLSVLTRWGRERRIDLASRPLRIQDWN